MFLKSHTIASCLFYDVQCVLGHSYHDQPCCISTGQMMCQAVAQQSVISNFDLPVTEDGCSSQFLFLVRQTFCLINTRTCQAKLLSSWSSQSSELSKHSALFMNYLARLYMKKQMVKRWWFRQLQHEDSHLLWFCQYGQICCRLNAAATTCCCFAMIMALTSLRVVNLSSYYFLVPSCASICGLSANSVAMGKYPLQNDCVCSSEGQGGW